MTKYDRVTAERFLHSEKAGLLRKKCLSKDGSLCKVKVEAVVSGLDFAWAK
jgi:hypothetical protein